MICKCFLVCSSVSTVARLLVERSRVWIPLEANVILFATPSKQALKPSQPPIKWVREGFCRAEKSREHGAINLFPHTPVGRDVKLRERTALPYLSMNLLLGCPRVPHANAVYILLPDARHVTTREYCTGFRVAELELSLLEEFRRMRVFSHDTSAFCKPKRITGL